MKKIWNRFVEWLDNGSPTLLMFKLITLCVLLPTSALFGLQTYLQNHNASALKNSFETLDKSPSVIFQSVAQCVAKGYKPVVCKKAEDTAILISRNIGMNISYTNSATCLNTHGTCKENIELITLYGGNGSATFTRHYTYRPLVVAWQASAQNLGHAVPLYNSATDGMAWRKDGTLLSLKP